MDLLPWTWACLRILVGFMLFICPTCLHFLISVLWCPLLFPSKKRCSVRLYYHLCCIGSSFIYVIYLLFWSPRRFPYHIMFTPFNSNTTTTTSRAGTTYHNKVHQFTPAVLWGSCFSLFCFLCRVMYIIVCPLSFFFSLHCPSIYSLWHSFFKLFLQAVTIN